MKKITSLKVLIIILYALIGLNIYYILHERGVIEIKINRSLLAMDEAIKGIKQPKDGKDGRNGYTPVKGKDYFDGTDGKDSVSTHTTVIKEVPINGVDGKDGYTPVKGVDYDDGKTPLIRCNTSKNRWEFKYDTLPTWGVIRDENGQPTKCKPESVIQ